MSHPPLSASVEMTVAKGHSYDVTSLATALLGSLALLVALLAAFHGGGGPIGILAGSSAAFGIAVWSRLLTGQWPTALHMAQDGLVVAVLAALVDPTARLWGVPYVWYELLRFTPLGEALPAFLGERFRLLQPAVERNLHPVLWDPVLVYLLEVPTAAAGLLLGFLLLWLGAASRPGIGIVTRR